MRYLTERQRDVLAFVERRLEAVGAAPTLREIAEEFGFSSTASAQKHIALLQKKGYLRREKHQKRGLTLPSAEPRDERFGSERSVPLLGSVAAGSPIEPFPDPESITLPAHLVGSGDHYALRVRGDSMIEDGIHDGDLVVVRSTESATDGEMVVALVAGEATLKRIYRAGPDTIRLQPSNVALSPLLVRARDVRVQGRIVGLVRRY